jgi:hypothetical protein
VLAGAWLQHQLRDGTFDVDDLITINRLLDMRDKARQG